MSTNRTVLHSSWLIMTTGGGVGGVVGGRGGGTLGGGVGCVWVRCVTGPTQHTSAVALQSPSTKVFSLHLTVPG